MKPHSAKSFAVRGCCHKIARCITWLLFLHYGYLYGVVSAVSKDAQRRKLDKSEELAPKYSGGMYEYRKVGAELVDLWREYAAMSEAISHVLRDYNIAVRQEQRDELTRVLAHRHQMAEASIAKHKDKKGNVSPAIIFGELSALNELKRQMKRLEKKVGQVPDYNHPEENAMLVEAGPGPVNVSKALSHPSAALFHKALESYNLHIESFKKKFQALRVFLHSIKRSVESPGRHKLISQAAAVGNIFDTDAPIGVYLPSRK